MKRMKYVESNVPEHIKVFVKYDHDGWRSGGQWHTEAKLLDQKTGRILARASSTCSRYDNPSRKIGRAIAVGRAFKRYVLLTTEGRRLM